MRGATFIFISLISLNLAAASINSPAPEQRKKHTLRNYGKSLIKRDTLTAIGASSAIGQVRHAPHEWGGGATGYAKRCGSGMAHYVVRDGIQRGFRSMTSLGPYSVGYRANKLMRAIVSCRAWAGACAHHRRRRQDLQQLRHRQTS